VFGKQRSHSLRTNLTGDLVVEFLGGLGGSLLFWRGHGGGVLLGGQFKFNNLLH